MNLLDVLESVEKAAARSSRKKEEISILPISKGQNVETIRDFSKKGFSVFGENYVQEWRAKKSTLPELSWHFVGRLQKNKLRPIVGEVELIQCVDKKDLASKISQIAEEKNIIQDILIQVNVSEEKSKGGVSKDEVLPLAEKILPLPGIRLRGLMGLPFFDLPEKESRRQLRELKKLYDQLGKHTKVDVLSMGTSYDYIWAIEEGATLIRLGRILLGER